MTLIATSGASDANSYVATAAEAAALAATFAFLAALGVPTAAFLALGTTGQETALAMAADRVDRATFIGVRFSSSQARAWPRVLTGYDRYDEVIPDAVKLAQVADACVLATAPTANTSMAQQGVSGFTVGEESVTFSSTAQASAERPFSPQAESILRQAGLIQSRVGSVYVPRM